MAEYLSVANAPKNATFQMRINPEIKERVEKIYARCGMTLTDAINVFIQQSLNVEGLPLIVTQNSKEAMREQAVAILMQELKKGEDSALDGGWLDESEILAEFGFAE
ncbi:MAG: type II toxin-antitoxin system RelB/DinJ family antitoxin [Clostridia bacterium]|nr:type II toxin-antitoxin system RelB/DinJ family antitoxin [Clostridia bacterium]